MLQYKLPSWPSIRISKSIIDGLWNKWYIFEYQLHLALQKHWIHPEILDAERMIFRMNTK